MKKRFSSVLALALCCSLAACAPASSTSSGTSSEGESSVAETSEESKGKIGIICGTVSYSEEEYRAAEYWKNKLGEDRVVIQTYPDNFMKEQETTISNMLSLVSDPDIKAVVFCQGVPGCAAAIAKAKEKRPDVLYIDGGPGEDPATIASTADIVIDMDTYQNATDMVDRAKEMGAETIIYYCFPRLLGYEKVSGAKILAEERAKELGIEFIPVTYPDPQSDAGTAGCQQFCREDIPKQLEKYGDTCAFWDLNAVSSVAVIKTLEEEGRGIYMNSSQSSPFNGYPEAFNISVPDDKKGDSAWMVEELQKHCAEMGNTGRFSVRATPNVVNCMNTGVVYAQYFIEGKTDGKVDMEALREAYAEVCNQSVDEVSFSTYTSIDGTESYDNYALILSPWAIL